MLFFKKKKEKEDEQDTSKEEPAQEDSGELPEVPVAPPKKSEEIGDASIGKLMADVEKLKAQFGTFYDLQKASTERFSRINEQIGELRSMIIERDKASQYLEAKTTQAIDLVKTVQPDKFMIELRKNEGKIEALKAGMEGSESITGNIVNELKEVKNKINVFRGMEQVLSLNEEAKKEFLEIKKIQAVVERHGDKIETIFVEMQKKFSDFIKFSDSVKDLDKSFKQISSEFDSIKVKISDFATKKEVENLISKFDDFEKYTGSIIKLMNSRFDELQKGLTQEFSKKFQETDKLLHGFEILAQKTPDLDKYFNLLSEEAKKAPQENVKVEKIKELGEEPKEPALPESSGGVLGKLSKIADKFKRK